MPAHGLRCLAATVVRRKVFSVGDGSDLLS